METYNYLNVKVVPSKKNKKQTFHKNVAVISLIISCHQVM